MTRRIMTKSEWRKKQQVKKIISLIISFIGGIALICSFCMDGPAAKYNGPIFMVSLVLTVLGILSLLVLLDQKYKDYLKDALQ